MRFVGLAMLLVLGACSKSARPARSESPRAGASPSAATSTSASPSPSASPAASPPEDCVLLYEVAAAGDTIPPGGGLPIEAFVTNRTDQPVTVNLSNHCPRSDVDFHGFGKTELYDSSCMMGACPGPLTDRSTTFAPGQRTSVGSARLTATMPCGSGGPVPPGTYTIAFTLPITPDAPAPRTCDQPLRVTLQ